MWDGIGAGKGTMPTGSGQRCRSSSGLGLTLFIPGLWVPEPSLSGDSTNPWALLAGCCWEGNTEPGNADGNRRVPIAPCVIPAGSTDLLYGTGVGAVGAVGAGNICSPRVLHRAGEDAWGCVGFPGAREELGSAVAVVPARPCAAPSRAGAALCRCSGMRPC